MSYTAMPIVLPKQNWDWEEIRAHALSPNDEPLVSLSFMPEKMVVSPQYFMQQLPGALPELYARASVQTMLVKAAALLPYGYKFVILDAWRAVSTQQALFDQAKVITKRVQPEFSEQQVTDYALKFVALPSQDPTRPSPHNTGGSIDLSIVNENGQLLDMGTPFDDLTNKAETLYFENHDDTPAAQDIRDNRRLLFQVMTAVGFSNYSGEWWHFDYGNQNWAWSESKETAIYGPIVPEFPWV
jgi:D-alanyl-D-alanine dipeptidase